MVCGLFTKKLSALLPLILAAVLLGCGTKPPTSPSNASSVSQTSPKAAPQEVPTTSPSSPPGYGAKEIKSFMDYVTYPVWSVDPREYVLDGIRLGDPFEVASKRYGKEAKRTPMPMGLGGSIKQMTEYQFAHGIRVSDADGMIYRIEADASSTEWETARGIKSGTTCATVLERFGPSHDGPDTYIYYTQGSIVSSVMTMTFSCKNGVIVGVDMSGF